MQEKDLAVLILAAGKGTRMENSLAKVLIPIAGKPTLETQRAWGQSVLF